MVTTMATMAVMSMAIRTAFVWYMLQTKKVTLHFSILLPVSSPTAPIQDRSSMVPEPKGLEHPLAPGSISVELAALQRTGGTPRSYNRRVPRAYLAIVPVISPMASVCGRQG